MARNPALLILLALSAFGQRSYAAPMIYLDELYGFQLTSDVDFGDGNVTTGSGTMDLYMDVYQPTYVGLAPLLSDRPAVVIQDGGAWVSGDKTNGRVTTVAKFLAKRGYTVFIADYRQVGDAPATAGPGPWNSLTPNSNGSVLGFLTSIVPGINGYRVAVEDFAKAISYVRTNFNDFDIDPTHIAGIGGSAGAMDLLGLQYNGDTSAQPWRTQANIAAVGSMMGDWDKVGANGAPLFLWNNELDPLIHYYNDLPNLHGELLANGIYFEQWFEYPDITDHNVHYDQYAIPDPSNPYMVGFDNSKLILDRMAEFLAYHFTSTGPIEIPEASSVLLVLAGGIAVALRPLRRRLTRRRALSVD